MFGINFDYSSDQGMSWMQWERLLADRQARAGSANGTCIAVETLATMTPYDPSAGGTRPIMYYLKHGWFGSRASMEARWPDGIAHWMRADHPYQKHMSAVSRWVINGPGLEIPDAVTKNIWESMTEWIERELFGGRMSPLSQRSQYRRGEGGAYGPASTREMKIINPWEKMSGGDEVKRRASAPAKYDPRFADVYGSKGPGFLESMKRVGPVVSKGG